MIKKKLIYFVFGTTAIATTMSFYPLSELHADSSKETFEFSSSWDVPTYELAKGYILEDWMPKANSNPTMVSMIAQGYKDHFENVSDDEGAPLLSPLRSRENMDEKVGNFTTSDAVEMARYAQGVYAFSNPEKDNDIQRFQREGSKVYSLKSLKSDVGLVESALENQDTGIFVVRPDGTAVLAFKGSDRLNTWFSDFDAPMTNHKDGGRYHNGFLTMYNELEASVWNHIMNFAEEHGYSIEEAMSKITITGHSRGAGCAQVFADIAQRKTGVVSKMITFAAPRALHKKTAGEFNMRAKDNHLNILQAKDIVGYIALGSLNGGAHIGHKVYLPVEAGSYMHMMGGYRKALNVMHATGEVKRDIDSSIGNTYTFKSANDDEDRDLLSENDNSVQAWVETGIDAVQHPMVALTTLSQRTVDIVQDPVGSTKAGYGRVAQAASNIGEVLSTTGSLLGQGAKHVGKTAVETVSDPVGSLKSVASLGEAIVRAPLTIAKGLWSLGSSVGTTLKDLAFGTEEVVESDESVAERQAALEARQQKGSRKLRNLTGKKLKVEKLQVEAKVIAPATEGYLTKAYNAIKLW